MNATALVSGLTFVTEQAIALVSGLAFVAQLAGRLARSDALFQLFNFQTDFFSLFHLSHHLSDLVFLPQDAVEIRMLKAPAVVKVMRSRPPFAWGKRERLAGARPWLCSVSGRYRSASGRAPKRPGEFGNGSASWYTKHSLRFSWLRQSRSRCRPARQFWDSSSTNDSSDELITGESSVYAGFWHDFDHHI